MEKALNLKERSNWRSELQNINGNPRDLQNNPNQTFSFSHSDAAIL
jgi:hypothetical protein